MSLQGRVLSSMFLITLINVSGPSELYFVQMFAFSYWIARRLMHKLFLGNMRGIRNINILQEMSRWLKEELKSEFY